MSIPDIELMLYSDGELEPERARRVRLARLRHLEVGARLEGIERVGAFVRAWAASGGVDTLELRRAAVRSSRRRRLFGGAAVALVVLAAAAEPIAGSASPPFAAAPVAGPAVAIESVDFGAHAGAVFVVEAESGVTPVVWLEDDAKAGG